jgi:hypothetical protein
MREEKTVLSCTRSKDIDVEVRKILYQNEGLHCAVPKCTRTDIYDIQFYSNKVPGYISVAGGQYCRDHLESIYNICWKETD